MLEEILQTLKNKKYDNIIFTNDIDKNIDGNDKKYIDKNFNVKNIRDVRSATFYALGRENLHEKSIVLIEGDDLQNVLTGITETWFQKLNIFIIALYKKYDDIKTDFIRRAMPNIIHIFDEKYEEYEQQIINATNTCYPSLITLKYKLIEEIYKYNDLLNSLKNVLSQEDQVFIYNSAQNDKNIYFKVKNIDNKYKYCIISKYMGYITGVQKKCLLCIPAKLLLLDLNILNNRYMNENFKLILFNYNEIEKENKIEDWIKNNNIKIIKTDSVEKELNRFWSSNEAIIMFLEGGI